MYVLFERVHIRLVYECTQFFKSFRLYIELLLLFYRLLLGGIVYRLIILQGARHSFFYVSLLPALEIGLGSEPYYFSVAIDFIDDEI